MTKISYIAGIDQAPPDERKDRGAYVGQASEYIPYTMMTKGELQLTFIRDQAQVFAEYYPDQPRHAEAVRMLDNALRSGVSGRHAFVGVIPDSLMDVARQIQKASRATQPAAGAFIGRTSLLHGIGVGEDQIIKYTEQDCMAYATREANKFYGKSWSTQRWIELNPILNKAKVQRFKSLVLQCQTDKEIEKLLNDKMVGSAHHMLYKNLEPTYSPLIGSQVLTKRTLHLAGIGGLHNASGVSESQMSSWVETGILRKNAAAGVGTYSSVASSMLLSPGGEADVAKYVAWATNKKKAKMMGPDAVGAVPLAVLIPVILAALKVASELLAGINAKKAAAMASANGFGSSAYLAEQSDFLTRGSGTTDGATPGNTSTNDMWPWLAVAAGAYLLLDD